MVKRIIHYFSNFPKDFRKTDLEAIKRSIDMHRNIQIVGPKGSGKSLTLRAIREKKTFSHMEVFLVDFNMIPERSSSAVLSLIWGSMNNWQTEDVLNEGSLLVKIQSRLDKYTLKGKRVLFLFDSFENLVEVDNPFILKTLSSLLDQNRDVITCIFSVVRVIEERILGQMSDVYFVSPLSEPEFDWFIEGLEAEYGKKIDSKIKDLIYEQSGGFIAICKRLFEIYVSDGSLDPAISNPGNFIHLRYQLDLLKEYGGSLNIPILDNYKSPQKFETVLEDKLTLSEYKIFNFLKENAGKICERSEIIEAVWGEKAARGVSDHALDQIINRLRKKLKSSASKLSLETVRGRGHRLV